jgi:hypothetical protein
MASALPVGPTISTNAPGLMRVVTPAALTQYERERDQANLRAQEPEQDQTMDELAKHVRTEWEMMRNHRNSASGWSERLLHAQRVFNGQYDATQLAAIKAFKGSEVYARVIALKSRGASALLREVYLQGERPWGLDPTPEPKLPEDVLATVAKLVDIEAQALMQRGMPLDLAALRDRMTGLMNAAKRAGKKKAKEEAKRSEDMLDDLLVEGGFYEALTMFITDLPLFPFACMKGPIVRIVPDIVWKDGKAVSEQRAKLFWNRVSPFDVYFTPGVQSIADANVIEKLRLTRTDLNDLIGLPGYREEAIRAVLDEYGRGGLKDWADGTDSERAQHENRENPIFNKSALLDCLEFHGNVQGRILLEYGMSAEEVPDELRDYSVQVWLIGRFVIKAQITPNPRKRHPYYITSFEKVPGTPVGNALPDILADIQDVCNATLRSLVNNLAIASGPQVVVDEERLSPLENGDELYPWKRWRVKSDPLTPNNQANPPVNFFNPQSNAQELLAVYGFFQNQADELSAIPRYITGSDKIGGAGRTASGLAMLMGNASKILQMVASNVDNDVIRPVLQALYDMIMITDTSGRFRGDEAIRVRGVEVAVQRETARQRQIELLQATANPIDMQIMGLPGRSKLLRAVSENVGITDSIVPDEEELMAGAQGMGPPGAPGIPPMLPSGSSGSPGPANMDLGVPEAGAMRGMASPTQHFEKGGLVQDVNDDAFTVLTSEGKTYVKTIYDAEGKLIGFEVD